IGSERCRHVDHADRRARCGDRLACRVEDGKIQVFLAAATRRDAADELRAVGDALLGMERALLAGEALTDYASGFVDKNGHGMRLDRKSTRLNSSHVKSSYAVLCLKKKSR